MPVNTSGAGVHKRRPSNKGRTYTYVRRGVEIVAAWPKKRGKNLKPNTVEQMEAFRQAQWAFKYQAPQLQVAIAQAVKGSPLMPRDLFLKSMSGRLVFFITPSGKRVFSMAGIKDVSANLDLISQDDGALLTRLNGLWTGLAPDVAGLVLTSQGPGIPPSWQPGGGSSGGNWVLQAAIDITAPTAPIVFDVTAFTDVMVLCRQTALAAIGYRGVLMSTDGGATYWNTLGDYVGIAVSGTEAPTFISTVHNTSSSLARTGVVILNGLNQENAYRVIQRPNIGDALLLTKDIGLPVTHIKILGQASAGAAAINFTSGSIYIWAR